MHCLRKLLRRGWRSCLRIFQLLRKEVDRSDSALRLSGPAGLGAQQHLVRCL